MSRSKEVKDCTITLRISQRQLKILQDYTKLKGLPSEAEGLRRMIEGAAPWVSKGGSNAEIEDRLRRLEDAVFGKQQRTQQASVAPLTSHQAPEHHIETTDSITSPFDDEDGGHSGHERSLTSIGGYTMVGLPDSHSDDFGGEDYPSIADD